LYCLSAIAPRPLGLLEELDRFRAFFRTTKAFFQSGRRPAWRPALHLAVHPGHPDVGDLGVEQRLDRLPDLGLGGVAVDLEHEGLLRLLEKVDFSVRRGRRMTSYRFFIAYSRPAA